MRIAGIILLVLAAVLLFFGINATSSVGERIVEGVTGKYTRDTMIYIITGALAAGAGLGMTIVGFKHRRA